jgi:hypothetical protein
MPAKQLLYGQAAQEHFVVKHDNELKEVQAIKIHLTPEEGREVDRLRGLMSLYIQRAATRVDSIVV